MLNYELVINGLDHAWQKEFGCHCARCQRAAIGAHARTIKGAAVDSAPKLAIAQPSGIGLGLGERSELTCCHRPKAVELGHLTDSIPAGAMPQPHPVSVSSYNDIRSKG